MYGVSPQPAHAPENSKSGCRSWTSFTWLWRKLVPVGLRKLGEEIPIRAFPLPQRRLRLHIDGFVFGLTLALYRTDLDAQLAPGAVFWRNLERVRRLSNSRQRGFSDLNPSGAFPSSKAS